ncbi:MAG: hypothetical protein V4568_15295 [Pseudomonadota bacterium]
MVKVYTAPPHSGQADDKDVADKSQSNKSDKTTNKTVGVYDKPMGLHSPQVRKLAGIAAIIVIMIILIAIYWATQ